MDQTHKRECPICGGAVEVHETGATGRNRGELEIDLRDCEHELVAEFRAGYGPYLITKAEANGQTHFEVVERFAIDSMSRLEAYIDSRSGEHIKHRLLEYIEGQQDVGIAEGLSLEQLRGIGMFVVDLVLFCETVDDQAATAAAEVDRNL